MSTKGFIQQGYQTDNPTVKCGMVNDNASHALPSFPRCCAGQVATNTLGDDINGIMQATEGVSDQIYGQVTSQKTACYLMRLNATEPLILLQTNMMKNKYLPVVAEKNSTLRADKAKTYGFSDKPGNKKNQTDVSSHPRSNNSNSEIVARGVNGTPEG